MPQVGELKHTIAIKSATPSRSATGGESQAWTTTVATCRAKIEPLRGEESLSAGIQDASVTHRVWIWYRSGITTKHRIYFGSRIFEILQATNFREESEWLEILAKEYRV